MHTLKIIFFLCVIFQTSLIFAHSSANLSTETRLDHDETPTSWSFLTKEEADYLVQNNRVKVCIDPHWMPFEAMSKNKHIGMSADYFELISKKLGIDFQLVPTKTWMESLEKAKARECDIFSLAMATPERSTYMVFTQPYIVVPLVIVTAKDKPFIADLPDILHHKIGLVKGYAYAEFLRAEYPQLDITEYETVYDGLVGLEKGEIYGFIDNLTAVSYEIGRFFSSSLKISGRVDRTWRLGIGVRNDDPILFSILNKAVINIDKSVVQDIQNKWISVTYEHQFDYSWLWKGLVAIAVILFLFAYRYWKIKKFNQELQQVNIKLKESKDTFRYLVNTAHEGICVVQNSKLVFVNPRMSEMTGYDEKSLLNMDNFLLLIAPEDRDMISANHQKRLAGKATPIRYESKFLKKDGTIYPIEVSGMLINWNNSPATMNMISDITERKAVEESIRFMALHDNLTNLPNRYLLMERLERALTLARRSNQPMGVIFMDLNGFKKVNDTHGHDVGDMLLEAITERILNLLRGSDTLARMGGDEFVILLPQVEGASGIETLIERIYDSFELPFQLKSLEVKSSASVGFSMFPEHGDTVEELLHVADQNMYKVKHACAR